MKTDIDKEFKDAGFVFKELTEKEKMNPKYLKAIELCKNEKIKDLRDLNEKHKDSTKL